MRLYALLLPRRTPNLPPLSSSECSERWSGFPFAVFVFDDGLIRLASEAYPASAESIVESLHSPLVHLTNNSINSAANGGAASNRSFLHFMRSLRTSANEMDCALAERIERQIAECVLSTISSSSSYLRDGDDPDYSRHFDLLGFDALLDDRAHLWLCEVNSMPDLKCAPSAFAPVHEVDLQCKRRLLADMCNLLSLHTAGSAHSTDNNLEPHTDAVHTLDEGTLPLGGFKRLI